MVFMFKNTSSQYGIVNQSLHWLLFLAVSVQIPIGAYVTTLSNEDILYYRLLDIHQPLGLLIFCLIIFKIIWRCYSHNPALLASIPAWQRWSAHIVHSLLLLALGIAPVLGYLFATARGDGIPILNLGEIPALIELNKQQAERVIAWHQILAYGIAVLALFHILAVLKHQLIDRDTTLKRMLFFTGNPR